MTFSSSISATTVLRGNVSGEGSLEVLGRVEGDIAVSGDVRVGPGASVVGAVSGARVSVLGAIEGNVTGTEAVVIEENGSVVGDVTAPRLSVVEGASLRGAVRTDPSEQRSDRASDDAAASERVLRLGDRAGAVRRQAPAPVLNAPRNARARKRAGRR